MRTARTRACLLSGVGSSAILNPKRVPQPVGRWTGRRRGPLCSRQNVAAHRVTRAGYRIGVIGSSPMEHLGPRLGLRAQPRPPHRRRTARAASGRHGSDRAAVARQSRPRLPPAAGRRAGGGPAGGRPGGAQRAAAVGRRSGGPLAADRDPSATARDLPRRAAGRRRWPLVVADGRWTAWWVQRLRRIRTAMGLANPAPPRDVVVDDALWSDLRVQSGFWTAPWADGGPTEADLVERVVGMATPRPASVNGDALLAATSPSCAAPTSSTSACTTAGGPRPRPQTSR